jgi:hypothetical protein
VLFLPLLFLPLGLFSFGHRRHAAARCSHHGEVLAGSSAATLWQVSGVPIAHIRALDRCRAAGRVFAGSVRVLTQRLSLSPRRRFDGGGQLRAPSPKPVELVERHDRVAARGHEIDSRREASVACATSLRLSGGAPHYAGSRSHPARRGLRRRPRPIRSSGNTEGTSHRARTSTRGHSSSGDSFVLRGFRARGFPALPALPASLLDGKEGVDGSSPSEGLDYLQISYFCCLT